MISFFFQEINNLATVHLVLMLCQHFEKLHRQQPGLSHGVRALLSDIYPEPEDNGGAWERCHGTATNWADVSEGRWLIFNAAGLLFVPLFSLCCSSHVRMGTVSVSLHILKTSLQPLFCFLTHLILNFWSNIFQRWEETLNDSVNPHICAGGAEARLVTAVVKLLTSRANELRWDSAQKSTRRGDEESVNDATSTTLSRVCLGFSCKLHPDAKRLQVSRPKTRSVIPLSL